MSWRNALLALCVAVVAGCATPPSKSYQPTPQQAHLAELMVQRLEVGRQVAWIKYVNALPVKDPKREAELLAALNEQGNRLGVKAATTEEFFGAQMGASRALQEGLIHGWKRGRPLPAYPPRDLKRDIRPQLDYISTAILRELRVVKLPDAKLAAYTTAQMRERGFRGGAVSRATAPLK